MKREHEGQSVCNTVRVGSVDEYADKVTSAGGTIVVPKSPIRIPKAMRLGFLSRIKTAVAE